MTLRAYLGIDLGTSALKALLLAEDGRTLAAAEREYPIDAPRPGWAEQSPEAWWQATVHAVRAACTAAPPHQVAGIGLSGQMHGTVLLDQHLRPLFPAIIWPDQRSEAQCRWIRQRVGQRTLRQTAGGDVYPGFLVASALWLREERADLWAHARSLLLPKDYLRLRLTGRVASDPTDASGALLADVARRTWSTVLATTLGIPGDLLPPILETGTVAGDLTGEAAQALGLPPGLPVVTGGADQATGALGAGVLRPGSLLVSLSSGGQIVAPLAAPTIDPSGGCFTFCHVPPDRWYGLAATLAAGLCLRWLRDRLGLGAGDDAYEHLVAEAASAPPGAGRLLFLPQLAGERVESEARLPAGAFLGLTLEHSRAHLVRAVLEGVALSLREQLDRLRGLGVQPTHAVVAGGGGRSSLWRQILADCLALPLRPLAVAEQSASGAALLAAAALGAFPNLDQAAAAAVRYGPDTEPASANLERYDELYAHYLELRARLAGPLQRLARG